MTHMTLSRQIRRPDWGSIKIFTLVILALLALAVAARLVIASIKPEIHIGIIYSESSFGFELAQPATHEYFHNDSIWTLFCGVTGFMSIALFVFGIVTGSVFRSFLGAGATRTATWIANIIDMVCLVLTAAVIQLVLAGVFSLIETPATTEDSLSVWASIPAASVTYLAFIFGGYLIALLFVRFHWIIGVGAILAGLTLSSWLPSKLGIAGIASYTAGAFSTPVVALAWFFAAIVAIIIALPIAATVPMRRS